MGEFQGGKGKGRRLPGHPALAVCGGLAAGVLARQSSVPPGFWGKPPGTLKNALGCQGVVVGPGSSGLRVVLTAGKDFLQ